MGLRRGQAAPESRVTNLGDEPALHKHLGPLKNETCGPVPQNRGVKFQF